MKSFPLNLIRNFFFLLVLILSIGRFATNAQPVPNNPENVTVRYIGMELDHLVFVVLVENTTKEKLRFKISDENNNVLFEDLLRKQKFEQKFLFAKDGIKDIRFEIKGKNYSECRQFGISTRTIEEVSVKEAR
ncbi:hypothetical protein CAP36_07475 [Chitinophagaceae bacterium IBVUCB2]|nr:hypothetical protein CAP36_07475 [Chitinophagaceae bacterium IBVUCB2]